VARPHPPPQLPCSVKTDIVICIYSISQNIFTDTGEDEFENPFPEGFAGRPAFRKGTDEMGETGGQLMAKMTVRNSSPQCILKFFQPDGRP
jgi:hypothetical protein